MKSSLFSFANETTSLKLGVLFSRGKSHPERRKTQIITYKHSLVLISASITVPVLVVEV
jgi:hypothetical protein